MDAPPVQAGGVFLGAAAGSGALAGFWLDAVLATLLLAELVASVLSLSEWQPASVAPIIPVARAVATVAYTRLLPRVVSLNFLPLLVRDEGPYRRHKKTLTRHSTRQSRKNSPGRGADRRCDG